MIFFNFRIDQSYGYQTIGYQMVTNYYQRKFPIVMKQLLLL